MYVSNNHYFKNGMQNVLFRGYFYLVFFAMYVKGTHRYYIVTAM